MRKVLATYRQLLGILCRDAPVMVALAFIASVIAGLMPPLYVFASQHVFDDGLRVAQGQLTFAAYLPYLALFLAATILPNIIQNLYIYGFVEPRAMMIFSTSYKGEMLKKLGRIRYEHFESEADMEVIDKAFHRALNSARHLFPMYAFCTISDSIASIGVLWQFTQVRWWLSLTLLIPFIAETWWRTKHDKNIYLELEHYWNRERRYSTLASFLRSRDHLYEGKLNASSDFLIETYRTRLNARNREYEKFYFRHLKSIFVNDALSMLGTLVNAVLLLVLYGQGALSVGLLIALMLNLFSSLYRWLRRAVSMIRFSGFHVNFVDYYNRFFAFSEDKEGEAGEVPADCSIEFRDVWFHYPGEGNPDILRGLSFRIEAGEKISLVGENGEGKSTMIKLLLGLFTPNRGEILLGGKPLEHYTRAQRNRMLAPVFQDFVRYSISLKENIAVGDIERLDDEAEICRAAERGQAAKLAAELSKGYDTLLGRDFEGGVDLSGGQWQRIAISRAFMGDKPILLLDEPTSQLDPMAESKLYGEFQQMAEGKTAIFITHRLASTMITDRILVLSGGRVVEEGNHATLMQKGGPYATMFDAQRKWYERGEEAAV